MSLLGKRRRLCCVFGPEEHGVIVLQLWLTVSTVAYKVYRIVE